jgi:antitoxin component of MazEF toxin-antitoxin module
MLDDTKNQIEFRKIQAIHGNSTLILVLPKDFAFALKITKGDYVKCKVRGNQLIVEKDES